MAHCTCSSAMPDNIQQLILYSGSVQSTNGENRESIPFQHRGRGCSDSTRYAYYSPWTNPEVRKALSGSQVAITNLLELAFN